jgi:orotidine-5'-phosphate decarboxylase
VSGKRPFGDVLAERVAERESQIVLGLDPDPGALWPGTLELSGLGGSVRPASGEELDNVAAEGAVPAQRHGSVDATTPAERAATAVVGHCRALIDATASACVAAKVQLACFERLGAPGWKALETVIAHARERGLLVIADGKRGDISVSATAYAQALIGGLRTPFGALEGLQADLVTVNPLMGRDAVEPFVRAAREVGGAVLLLVRTSNPGAADIEDLTLAGGEAVWERVAMIVDELGAPGLGESGLGDVGAVVGATVPSHLTRARELMRNATFLLPGVGAQGGRVEDLAPAFVPGRAGGLITASRSIANAHLATGGSPAHAALVETERLREAAWTLFG